MINMIAAISKNNQIGLNNHMPWHIPEDLAYFKQVTLGHPVIMGRKTYESIGNLLPNRHNIILTQNPSFSLPESSITTEAILAPASALSPPNSYPISSSMNIGTRVDIVHSISEVFALLPNNLPSFIIGGGEIYRTFLPYADRLYLTIIHQTISGDTSFPSFEEDFHCISSTPGKENSNNNLCYDFTIWERKNKSKYTKKAASTF